VICSRKISRSPINLEAKRAMAPFSEAEHLKSKSVAAVLHNRLGLHVAVGSGDLAID
jgi:hypothetical protein